jgi:hypothetical protein
MYFYHGIAFIDRNWYDMLINIISPLVRFIYISTFMCELLACNLDLW